jgi:uncharacterized protein YjbI with pentapeptide repeats
MIKSPELKALIKNQNLDRCVFPDGAFAADACLSDLVNQNFRRTAHFSESNTSGAKVYRHTARINQGASRKIRGIPQRCAQPASNEPM